MPASGRKAEMVMKLPFRKRGAVVAGVVLAGVLAAGGATAYAVGGDNSGHPAKTAAAAKGKHRAGALFGPGIHGEATVKNGKKGTFTTREWQRGQVTAVAGDNVTVKSEDGFSWTWTVAGTTKIGRDGKQITVADLKSGDQVAVVGTKQGSANDATRIFAPSQAQLAKQKDQQKTQHPAG
jgi:hypothetical protein